MSITNPMRFPDTGSRKAMTKRAWWLIGLNILIPGSAQLLAGSRRLGRFGVVCTFIAWLLVITALVLLFTAPRVIYSAATNEWALLAAEVLLFFYAVLWVVLTVDTLRLARLGRASRTGLVFVSVVSIAALLAVAGVSGYSAYLAGVGRGVITDVFNGGGKVAEPIEGRFNILLLGGDAGAGRVGLRPDSISVVSVDAETGNTTLIGVPRNLYNAPFAEGSPLWKPFPNGYSCGNDCLVSYLYTYGESHPALYPDAKRYGSSPGVEAMRDAIEGVLGLKLQYYVLIDMAGFANLVDALGGITIDVKERLPIGGDEQLRGVDGWIEPGVQHMDGYTALWYARSRHTTTDYDRMARQREVQEAILKQFTPMTVLTKFQAIAEAGKHLLKTDIPSPMLGQFVEVATKARSQHVTTLELVPPTIVTAHPDYDKIHRLVQDAVAPEPKAPNVSPSPVP